jgi:hypothetical protein
MLATGTALITALMVSAAPAGIEVQEAPPAAAPGAGANSADHPQPESKTEERKAPEPDDPLALVAIRFTGPQRVSLSLEAAWFLTTDGPRGFGTQVQVEPGVGGLKLQAGVFSSNEMAMTSVKASFLHTWGLPAGTVAGRDYAGAELSTGIVFLDFSFGIYRRIGPDNGARDWLFSTSVGVLIGIP